MGHATVISVAGLCLVALFPAKSRACECIGSGTACVSMSALRASGGSPRGWPILTSDSTLGVAALGDSITQLSLPDRNWIVRVPQAQVSAFVKDEKGRYWIGTRNGVSQLIVDGSEWRLIPAGLEGRVSALAVAPDRYLLAAIENRGILRARLP